MTVFSFPVSFLFLAGWAVSVSHPLSAGYEGDLSMPLVHTR